MSVSFSRNLAVAICSTLDPIFHSCGYLLGLYGSTLIKGEGRDIDLLAVPWHSPNKDSLYIKLRQLGWEPIASNIGITADSSVWKNQGVIIDIRFTRWTQPR